MVFNSYIFLIFFPIVVIIYQIIPVKLRSVWLLIASYYFYMSWNAKYAILILLSTTVTYLTGVLIGKTRENNIRVSRTLLGVCFIVNLGILFFFKYFHFFFGSVGRVLGAAGIAFH